MVIKVLNPDYFVSSISGKSLSPEKTQLAKFVEAQLPHDISEEDMADTASKTSNAMNGLLIVQALAQVSLKGSMNDLVSLFMTLQLICYFTIYGINLPSNAEMYVE